MNLTKTQIVDYLNKLGRGEAATEAEAELPDTVDTDTDGELLTRFGIETEEIIERFDSLFGN